MTAGPDADLFCRQLQHHSFNGASFEDHDATRETSASKSIRASDTFNPSRIDDGQEVRRFSGLGLN